MNKFIDYLEKYFMPAAEKISTQRHLKAIRDGIITTMPLMIIGSVFMIIAFPPIPALADVVEPFVDDLVIPTHATFEIMSLVAVFAIAYNLGKSYKLDGLTSGTLALASFVLVTPRTEAGDFPVNVMDSNGLFVAIILAVLSVEIYRFIVKKNLVIKMPEGVPESVSKAFIALIPGFAIIFVTWVLRLILTYTFELSIHDVITAIFQAPLSQIGGSFLGGLVAIILIQLFWSAGIHGISVVASVMAPIWYALTEENVAAMAAGEPLPNIMTQQMSAIWTAVGGSGMVLALAILLLFAKSERYKSLGKMTIWSSFFNISEPILFGAPIVMNPILMIPFILAPVVTYFLTYGAMALELVQRSWAVIPWTTPAPFSGWLMTGDWRGAVLMIINVLVSIAIYYPFFRVVDRREVEQEQLESAGENE